MRKHRYQSRNGAGIFGQTFGVQPLLPTSSTYSLNPNTIPNPNPKPNSNDFNNPNRV